MTSRGLQALFFQSSHPTDEELLAYLDGELQGRAMARIRTHLDTCWSCRGRRDRFDRTIAAFVDTRQREHAQSSGMPPSARLKLSARLDAVDARAVRPPLWRRLWWRLRATMMSAARPSFARALQVSVALLMIVVIALSIGREPVVSAQELLDRTVAAQEARLRPVAQPVVYQRLQVSRRGARAGDSQETWELWSDTAHGRYRERVGVFAPIAARTALDARACAAAPASIPRPETSTATASTREANASVAAAPAASASTPIRELESILCANGLAVAQPLSAAAFRQWRGGVRAASDDVRTQVAEGGHETMVLRTSLRHPKPAARHIREAELVVRAGDWHPLAQRFTVEGDGELVSYELRELSFEIVPLASVAPTFFEDARETTTLAAPAAAPAADELVNDADLVSAEVQAWDALHRAGALLGEPVEVVRTPARRIEVRGLATTPDRKRAIVDAVGAIPLVTVELRTVDEALAARASHDAGRSTARHAPAGDAATMVQTGMLPAQPLIDLYLSGEGSAASRAPAARASAGTAGPATGAAATAHASSRSATAGATPAAANATGVTASATGGQTASLSARRVAVASDIVSASRMAMSRAWALERLAHFAQGLDPEAVRPTTRRMLERMAHDLAAATAGELAALDARVQPILAPLLGAPPRAGEALPGMTLPGVPLPGVVLPGAPAPGAPQPGVAGPGAEAPLAAAVPGAGVSTAEVAASDASAAGSGSPARATDWPRGALIVFARTREADAATRRLFTESAEPAADLSSAARQLIDASAAARAQAETLARRLDQESTRKP